MSDKDKKVIIRTVHIGDAEALVEVHRSVVLEDEYLIRTPEEFVRTVDEERDWIRLSLENERETIIVAEYDGKAVGWVSLQSPNRKRLNHTGTMSIMVHKNYRDMGIGRQLIAQLLHWAEANPLIEKINLGVLSTNPRAIALYKKMGFIEEGRAVKEIKLGEGRYADDVLMCKYV